MAIRFTKDWGSAFIALCAAVVFGLWALKATGTLIDKDAYQNLSMAYNLVHHGTMSLDTDRRPEELRPSRYREPLPVLTTAAYLRVFDARLGGKPMEALLEGPNAKLLKHSNAPWALLLLGVVALTALQMTGSKWMAGLAIVLSYWPLSTHYDELYTEIPGAALLAIVSYLIWRVMKDRRALNFFGTGLAFGALILTKASFLYVAIVLIVLYACFELYYWRDSGRRRVLFRSIALTVAGTVIVIAPWMVRNQIHFGSPQIADRGGLVLLTRAIKNQMTAEEYVGAFYVYAPYFLREPIGFVTGFKNADIHAGGPLERLRRNANIENDEPAADEGRLKDVISYYYRAKATRAPILAALNAAGHPNPLAEADAQLQKEAIQRIKADPGKHLVMTLPFMFRGAIFMFPFFCVMLIYAWRRREIPLIGYVLPSFGLICFYALVSHFIMRYANPSAPIVAVCAVVLLHQWLEHRRKITLKTEGVAPASI
ncbi:MAG TPA: hypothetical protein VJM53_11040 [Burkholderiales bacterium]|nr:hypothetical protein [Burkholderiales bacterium]